MEQAIRQNYIEEVKQIKEAIQVSRYRAARQVNSEILKLYYSIGRFISLNTRNAKWGSGALKSISLQLQQEMPGLKGFSEGNMRKMRLFYEAWQPVFEPQMADFAIVPVSKRIELIDFRAALPSIIRSQPANEMQEVESNDVIIRATVSHELGENLLAQNCATVSHELTEYDLRHFLNVGFSSHYEIIKKIVDFDEIWFYIHKCAMEFWGFRQLQNALLNDLYHQQSTMPNNFALTLPNAEQRAVAMRMFKEDNVFDFLKIPNPDLADEHDVEE